MTPSPISHHNQGQMPHLTADQRQELLDLIAANPLASCPRIAELFTVQTGRPISKVTIRRAWVHGYPAKKEVTQ